MSVSEQDVERVAELASLALTNEEKVAMARDLNAVLGYFAQLNELDTTSVPPMTKVTDRWIENEPEAVAAELRPDEVAPSLSREKILASAPDTDGVFFRVPKVIER
jgi:aspartyl-tRNA(Asn)/glutamyl-tRNA(Gln) amidotransferase subunit C